MNSMKPPGGNIAVSRRLLIEQQQVNEEFKLWKKNTPFLYDLVVTHALEWPTLTCQWFPDIQSPEGKDYTIERMLIGTHTSNMEQNYVQIANVLLPKEPDSDVEESGAGGGGGGPAAGGSSSGAGGVGEEEALEKEGGYGGAECRIQITQKINHEGEVNRARYMPQKPDIIATRAVTGDVFIFDRTRHPSKPNADGKCHAEITLRGHSKEGYGLSWNPLKEGQLLTSSEDCNICHWDISSYTKNNNYMDAVQIYSAHTAVVEDVSWHPLCDFVFASVSDDQLMMIWDTRKASSNPGYSVHAHKTEIYTVAFSPFNEYLVASGAADQTVALWDLRNLSRRLHKLKQHHDDVIQLAWSPHDESILASASGDRRVNIWDLSKIGDLQTRQEAIDGPPELMFIHGGHTNKLSDLSWNLNHPWVICSSAEDNICQIWRMVNNQLQNNNNNHQILHYF